MALTRLRPPRQACVIVRRGGNDRDAVRPPSIPSGHVTPDLQSPFDVGIVMATLVRDTFKGDPARGWKAYGERGMDPWRDLVDWVGGYPYEVATVDEIFDYYRSRAFTLIRVKSGGVGLGCNEFVFERTASS